MLMVLGDEDLQSTKDANIIINGENGLIIQFGIYPEPMTYVDYPFITTAGTGKDPFTFTNNQGDPVTVTTMSDIEDVEIISSIINIDWGGINFGSFNINNTETTLTVTSGSLSTIPIPAAALLLGSELVGMLGLHRSLR